MVFKAKQDFLWYKKGDVLNEVLENWLPYVDEIKKEVKEEAPALVLEDVPVEVPEEIKPKRSFGRKKRKWTNL